MGINSVALNYLIDTQLLIEFEHSTSMDVFDKVVTSNVVMEDMPIYKIIGFDETISVSFVIGSDAMHTSASSGQIIISVKSALDSGKTYSYLKIDELLKIDTIVAVVCGSNGSMDNVFLEFITPTICALYKTYLAQKSDIQICVNDKLGEPLTNTGISADSFITVNCNMEMLAEFSLLTEEQTISLKSSSLNAKVGRYRTVSDIADYTINDVGNWTLNGLYFDEKE